MNAWKLSTRNAESQSNPALWRDTLAKVYLPQAQALDSEVGFCGDVTNIVSPQGIEFSRLCAAPQAIEGSCTNQPYAMWLSVVMEGRFSLVHKGRVVTVQAGDIIFSPTGVDARLELASDFKMLYVKIPRGLIHPRLLNPSALEIGALSTSKGINRVFSSLLMSVGESMDDMDGSMLRPVEVALTEFVISSLTQQTLLDAFGSTTKMLHYQRICKDIDNQLQEPDLSLPTVAQRQQVSPRYIQKLFEAGGTSFGAYVRTRRLERCRFELESPQYGHLSISDICFRWGFNDAAHFSRSYRAEFGMTPRDSRQRALAMALPVAA